MIPTRVRDKNQCVRCCLASLLEMRGLRVPDFHNPFRNEKSQIDAVTAWLANRGLALVRIAARSKPACYYLAIGPSERGFKHMVIMRGGELADDCHSSQAGLLRVSKAYLVVPMDIGAWKRVKKGTEMRGKTEEQRRAAGRELGRRRRGDIARQERGTRQFGPSTRDQLRVLASKPLKSRGNARGR